MKKIFITLSFALLTSASLSAAQTLEGTVFERTFQSKPEGAMQPLTYTHTLTFGPDWTVTDNSSTWYGKEPNKCTYGVLLKDDKKTPGKIFVMCDGKVSQFLYKSKGGKPSLIGRGLALTMKKDKAST